MVTTIEMFNHFREQGFFLVKAKFLRLLLPTGGVSAKESDLTEASSSGLVVSNLTKCFSTAEVTIFCKSFLEKELLQTDCLERFRPMGLVTSFDLVYASSVARKATTDGRLDHLLVFTSIQCHASNPKVAEELGQNFRA
jgi:hypothetical protein